METCFACHAAGTHRVSVRLDLQISKRGRKIAERITCDHHVDSTARAFKRRFPGTYVRVLVAHVVTAGTAR